MATISINADSLKPIGDRVLVKVSAREEKTVGGILLPDTAKDKPQVGEVVAVGSGVLNDKGIRVAPEVTVGSRVLYSKYGGTEIKLSGEDYLLLTERDLLAVVEA